MVLTSGPIHASIMHSLLRPGIHRLVRAPPAARASARRTLHLAPPFLLDDYRPRYSLLSSVDASKKRSKAYAHLANCNLCPRECGVNRFERTGMCLVGEKAKVNVIAPHFGEGVSFFPNCFCLSTLLPNMWRGRKGGKDCFHPFVGVSCLGGLCYPHGGKRRVLEPCNRAPSIPVRENGVPELGVNC